MPRAKPFDQLTPRGKAMRNTSPVATLPKRGMNKGKALEARARGTDTSNLSAEKMLEVISPDKPLTEKQNLFVKYWAQGDSVASASLRAGYNDAGTVGYRLVKMPNVLALKAKYAAEWESENQMNRKKVMDGMLEAIEMAKLMSEPSSMIAGWREIGKICGYYAPVEHRMKVDVTGNVVLDKLNGMSDAELLKMITSGTQAALQGPSLS